MDDVVLHCRPGSASRLSFLLETAEKVLEPFSCRTSPVFTSWFPTSADHQLPIRPARPAPVVTSSTDKLTFEPITSASVKTQQSKDAMRGSETLDKLLPFSHFNKPRGRTRLSPGKQPEKDKDGHTATDCPIKRSWSVFSQRGVLLQSSQSLSKQFTHVVSIHSLHLRQRAKWAISEVNCGAATSIEQVWRNLTRFIQRAKLPTCNANIQRERAEIWVFCDVLHAEQVGHFLKEQLQLSGRISLSVHRLGNIFSL
ncbi:shieldin complex subunit 3 [Betta splendens]|uniref:Shieldin complex subunit 3 n=1 Tax=Betta splendens TaxID=158456 RepID=A0A6P7NL78_BETSP|nr:shieldin complex subunit 3 [Betta splendens]XP_029018279.1 shieldin complex subunit 3 [Betta splendens]XP_040928430.1 shieldin complex subunit 3 [Betta splendens]XP_055367069.1 shieldin complex subunit 3 [Betta splendens]XP_055367070.1 shieldin complex subunit 3 [Betta splendens]XP_055367071.1 shieldin complex subunit 3 [Betta splendens]